MTGTRDHHCPGCGKPLAYFARYPWHFCTDCAGSAVDGDGAALEFANESLSGGFMFRRVGEADWTTCGSIVAIIRGRRVKVHEARFGGIVAEPLTETPPGQKPYRMIDLTRPAAPVPKS